MDYLYILKTIRDSRGIGKTHFASLLAKKSGAFLVLPTRDMEKRIRSMFDVKKTITLEEIIDGRWELNQSGLQKRIPLVFDQECIYELCDVILTKEREVRMLNAKIEGMAKNLAIKIEDKEILREKMSKYLFNCSLGLIYGMWKRRRYTEIKDLAKNTIPGEFFKMGYEKALEDFTSKFGLKK